MKFNPQTNIMWVVYLARYIYNLLNSQQIGSESERSVFVRHFQSLHRSIIHYLILFMVISQL